MRSVEGRRANRGMRERARRGRDRERARDFFKTVLQAIGLVALVVAGLHIVGFFAFVVAS